MIHVFTGLNKPHMKLCHDWLVRITDIYRRNGLLCQSGYQALGLGLYYNML